MCTSGTRYTSRRRQPGACLPAGRPMRNGCPPRIGPPSTRSPGVPVKTPPPHRSSSRPHRPRVGGANSIISGTPYSIREFSMVSPNSFAGSLVWCPRNYAKRGNLGSQTDRSCRPGGPKGHSRGRKPPVKKQLDQEPRRGERKPRASAGAWILNSGIPGITGV